MFRVVTTLAAWGVPVSGVAVLGAVAALGTTQALPCAGSGRSCTEWIALPAGGRSLVYRSRPLDVRDDRVSRALVVVHDIARDAEAYFRTGIAAARRAGELDRTIVIAPRFASRDGLTCGDSLAVGELNWPCEGNSWRSGGRARNGASTSFDFADEILRKLARRALFPNLTAVVVSGHSAGGQFVTRYQMSNRVHDTLGVQVSYVVANPSSYAYPDPTRPVVADGRIEFRPFSDSACAEYDRWPYGLTGRSGYAEELSAEKLRQQLVERPATYLLGELDVQPVDAFDASCAAMAQGPTRLARGRAFGAYVERLLARHVVRVVAGCGHDARCMFVGAPALAAFFPDR